jgi:hypothetical protein
MAKSCTTKLPASLKVYIYLQLTNCSTQWDILCMNLTSMPNPECSNLNAKTPSATQHRQQPTLQPHTTSHSNLSCTCCKPSIATGSNAYTF